MGYWFLRHDFTSTKNGGKIWILRDRQKGFSERPKKVHFWKIQFQNLFEKSKIRNFAAIFIYIQYMDVYDFVENGISKWRAKKIFLRSDPSGPRSRITTNQTISILICSRIDDSLLCKFSQNVLQIDMLREIDVYDFVVVGQSGLRPSQSVHLRGAKRRGIYLQHVLQINTYQLVLYRDIEK